MLPGETLCQYDRKPLRYKKKKSFYNRSEVAETKLIETFNLQFIWDCTCLV